MVGELLKNKRQELGKDLRDISEKLKIKYDYLKAIEEGDTKRLPAEVYVRGYISDYAKYLNLDPETILSEFNKERVSQINVTESITETKKPSALPLIIIVLALVITASLLLKFFFINNFKSKQLDQSRGLMTETIKKEQNPVNNKITSSTTESSMQEHNKPAILPKETQHELEIFADDTTWLLVVVDGEESKEYLLKSGDSIKCLARKNFSLKIGNAGGIKIKFNGKDYNKLGQKGQVIKLVLPENSKPS